MQTYERMGDGNILIQLRLKLTVSTNVESRPVRTKERGLSPWRPKRP